MTDRHSMITNFIYIYIYIWKMKRRSHEEQKRLRNEGHKPWNETLTLETHRRISERVPWGKSLWGVKSAECDARVFYGFG